MTTPDSIDASNETVEFSTDYFYNPPPNQNPIIGAFQNDTLINVRDCLMLLGDISLYKDTMMADGAITGYYHLMTCLRQALAFEIDHRDRLEAEKKRHSQEGIE